VRSEGFYVNEKSIDTSWDRTSDLPYIIIIVCINYKYGTAVAQWLRCCATNRKVAGSIPDGVIGIFH